MSDCIFCTIAKHELPSYTIYEDDSYIAFLDIIPMGEGHIQFIPKTHYPKVWDVPEIGKYMELAQKIVHHMNYRLGTDACYSFIIGEQIAHAHIQILPATHMTKTAIAASFSQIGGIKIDDSRAIELQQLLMFPPNS